LQWLSLFTSPALLPAHQRVCLRPPRR
jgi:hypothetical protein